MKNFGPFGTGFRRFFVRKIHYENVSKSSFGQKMKNLDRLGQKGFQFRTEKYILTKC